MTGNGNARDKARIAVPRRRAMETEAAGHQYSHAAGAFSEGKMRYFTPTTVKPASVTAAFMAFTSALLCVTTAFLFSRLTDTSPTPATARRAFSTEALQWLQCASELPQHGALDRVTWRHLANLYRQTVGDGTGVFPYRVTHKTG